jgi:Leucine-rich repeat (LRR) protein
MAECTLKHIPVMVWNTTSIQTLDISRNKVGYIVSEIGNLTDIRHLRLSQMDLDTLPAEIGFCNQLESMDLTGNPIDNLPETLVECRHLSEFKISYKKFYKLLDNYMLQLINEGKIRSEHIPHVIFELENLQILDLNDTKLNSIPNDHTLLNLNELYLSNNSFFNIPESICTMEQLKILDMSYNRLENIPDYFLQIKRLETLILSYNNLTNLPNIITRLSTLTKLIVNHNQINTIEDGISQSQSLLILDLSYNNLKQIPNDLCNLKQLETLDLRYNQLEYLPLSIRQMTNLKSMNTFDDDFQRIGLHLLGNAIIDPPSYIWKSTLIQTLFDYIETKDKNLSNQFFHLKLIFIGPKNTGTTTLMTKLLGNQKLISDKRKTLDMYMSILQDNQLKFDEQNALQGDNTSSILTDQWIENRISTNEEYFLSHSSKVIRLTPPPLKTYRSNEIFEYFINKSILITKNNLSCTIFDIKSEPIFEILYPLIYDSNALFILPVNLTILANIIQVATNFENQISIIDYDILLTNDWLYHHIFRYIESIADHCHRAFIAIVGLILNDEKKFNDDQQQELLDEIHSRINMFITNEEYQRKNIILYSEFFPEPIHLDDENMSEDIIEILEIIAQQWNMKHHKQKRQILKQQLGFNEQDSLIIDYETCLKYFKQTISSFDEDQELLKNEINQMNLDDCLTYLTLTGDIITFNQSTILLKPYYLLNTILSRTIFRPHIEQWLNYDENLLFHFSGYYPTEELFNIDRQCLLTRGEYTWKMLTILFFAQNNNNESVLEQTIIDYCRLMECLHLGYVIESNLNCKKKKRFFCSFSRFSRSRIYDYLFCLSMVIQG